jgi:hypothetical protein
MFSLPLTKTSNTSRILPGAPSLRGLLRKGGIPQLRRIFFCLGMHRSP